MRGLPNDVKRQFYLEKATLYPDYNAILSKVDSVIKTLNKIGLNTKDSTMKHNPNNSNSNSSKAQSINSVTNQPSNSSKSGYKGNRKGAKKNCRFCQSSDHYSADCPKYPTLESRIAVLRSHLGNQVCDKCTQSHTGACSDKFRDIATLKNPANRIVTKNP